MGGQLADSGLHRIADVIDAGARSLPVDGRLPAPVLRSLAALIPADCVTFLDMEPGTATHYAADDVVDGVVGYLTDAESDPTDAFWRHYAQSLFCSYPTRTGDDRSVTSRSDFYTTREWKQTPMYVDVMSQWGHVFELMCPLPAPTGRSRRVIFARSGSRDFTEEDRFALALLRPHLAEMVGRACPKAGRMPLTKRQAELMRLVADGHTNAEIAKLLHLSPHTVRTHLTNIFERLGVATRAAAVARVLTG